MTAGTPLERRLEAAGCGDVLFDPFSRGRYATDASAYQIMPVGAVAPRSVAEAETAIGVARTEGVCVTARGGGTSQSGQTVNEGLVVDCSKYLNKVLDLDVAARTCRVEPGLVLDDLNRRLKPHGLWFPVDVSTASRATIGGMAGNNSCGGRSLRYGTMRDNVMGIDAVLADGTPARFATQRADLADMAGNDPRRALFADLLRIGAREADEVEARFPAVQRRVGGYNLDALVPAGSRGNGDGTVNMAHLLVGSEGTLAFSTALDLKLWPLMGRRGLGVCHFGSFFEAMDAAQHLVTLKPIAVELVDATMLSLAGEIAMFKPTLDAFVKGEPEALLLVEFAEDDAGNARRLRELHEMMGALGFGWDKPRAKWGGVVDVLDAKLQGAIADLRTSGLNIMMSMKDARKPVSFVEDCAVPLAHLAEYTEKLTAVFAKHGTKGTWYAHASEGCLHVRPVLNLKLEKDVRAMRAIAEEAFALVKSYKGSHSGEHGDGIVRSEFHATMYGERLVRSFGEVKERFDPARVLNPGKIVDAPKFDDRSLFRFKPDYAIEPFEPALDWSAFPGGAKGLSGAVEMCNNNGACRKLAGGVMCPSYRATRDEKDTTRGRANVLRLALSKQLGPDAMTSEGMAEAMKLCVSCKACRSECPTGVDMARMKIEVQAARLRAYGPTPRDRLVGYLPRYARLAARVPWLLNLRNRVPALARLTERVLGLAAGRSLPTWRTDRFEPTDVVVGPEGGHEVVLFADTFNRAFERETLDAALRVLVAGGYRVHLPRPADGSSRPLCCGRTFLSVGMVEEARTEVRRSLAALLPYVAAGMPVIGLEPSCLLTFRDEALALLPGEDARRVAGSALLLEEFLAKEADAGRLKLDLHPLAAKAVLHGHCHQKSFRALAPVEKVLRLVPGLELETIESSCCGMAGAFGYQAETAGVSLRMAELSLLPAVRRAPDAIVVADGTSCRHQIRDGAEREALHVARVLAASLDAEPVRSPAGHGDAVAATVGARRG